MCLVALRSKNAPPRCVATPTNPRLKSPWTTLYLQDRINLRFKHAAEGSTLECENDQCSSFAPENLQDDQTQSVLHALWAHMSYVCLYRHKGTQGGHQGSTAKPANKRQFKCQDARTLQPSRNPLYEHRDPNPGILHVGQPRLRLSCAHARSQAKRLLRDK